MQSRISFFDKTVFRKNLTRFAPAWILYTVCMFMGLFLMMDSGSTFWLGENMAQCIQVMAVITPCYALLVAQLLFGDLYNARMCNALHALPLRRETWFFTNVASALVFHLIPTVAMGSAATVLMALTGFEGAWVTGLYWILGTNLQFLGYFGMALVSTFCVGNRFAMAIVYGMLNLGAVIAAWLISELFVPMYYGVQMDYGPISMFSPFYRMAEEPFISVNRIYEDFYQKATGAEVLLGEAWWYYWIFAAVGCGLAAAAVQLYRKRQLECAGDFMAIKILNPVFHVVYSLVVGAVFSFVVSNILGFSNALLFLFLGITVGYFTGRMLLDRNVNVFRLRNIIRYAILIGLVALSLVAAKMDPFGIESWMPEKDQVKSVFVGTGHYTHHESQRLLTEPEDIENVLKIHQYAISREGDLDIEPTEYVTLVETVPLELGEVTVESKEEDRRSRLFITIRYTLQDGRKVSRYYEYWNNDFAGEMLQAWFSSPESLFGESLTAQQLLDKYPRVEMNPNIGENQVYTDWEALLGLYEAMLLDCEEGTMARDWDFHYQPKAEMVCWLNFRTEKDLDISIFSDARHTIAWLKDHGYDWEEVYQKYYNG